MSSTLIALRKATTTVAARSLRCASTTAAPSVAIPSFTDLQAAWPTLEASKRSVISKTLDERMEGDWREMSLDEKKSAFYVSYGPHGPRTPRKDAPASKVLAGVAAVTLTTGVLFYTIRQYGQETPETMTREWQEKTNELMHEQKNNPITGMTSEGYSGKGMIQSD
ncbi:MAG: cytochrome c oxidase subunit V [Piptocephalis tieghemiana]|nr:MAG: cytochrome c oxidase subunit V [Piptocephalis tieghemiana]